jgi:hypothetical protein
MKATASFAYKWQKLYLLWTNRRTKDVSKILHIEGNEAKLFNGDTDLQFYFLFVLWVKELRADQ